MGSCCFVISPRRKKGFVEDIFWGDSLKPAASRSLLFVWIGMVGLLSQVHLKIYGFHGKCEYIYIVAGLLNRIISIMNFECSLSSQLSIKPLEADLLCEIKCPEKKGRRL